MRTTIYILILLFTALSVFADAKDEVVIDGPQPAKGIHYDGIDVSSYQKDIDWSTTARDKNIQYVYVKATEGRDYVSRHYEINIRNARKHGVKVGSYHFLRTGSSIRAQFENFKRTARKEDQDLIPLIDVEVRNGWTDQQVRDSVRAFADLLEDYYGCKPMIYTSVSFFNKILGRAFADYPLFIARYATNPPVLNGAKWTLWQFSEKGRIAGIDHHVDLSCFNKGCSLKDIAYRPGKSGNRSRSVADEVDRKEKPDHVSVGTTSNKVKEAPKKSKRQEAEEKKQAEKDRKAKERAEKMAQDEAKKKAAEAKKAKEKQERLKQEEQKRQAKEKAKKEAQDEKAAAKAARKAQAQKARQQRAQEQQAKKAQSTSTTTKRQTLLQSKKSNLTQSQRNDSARAAQQKGRKINKSSADND